MTEETVFAAALEKSTAAARAAFLDEACSGDALLRGRVEALLQSHTEAGDFLETPAVQRAVEELEAQGGAATQAEMPSVDDDGTSLDFLAPSEKPGSLGRLGHYEALEIIGRGGMGVVLRAFDEKLHRMVAIKVMAPQLATNATARKRFVREAQAAAAVRNEHVVDIYAVEEADGLPYLAMEFVAGVSLQERLERSGPLGLKEILRISMQTAAGLAAAHAQGLIHRDVKPSNILLENGVERVRITDFGLARAVDDASLTQTGVITGTPQYMAPEQARGEPVDHRADLFSLGSVLYAMCAGRAPFRASGSMAVLKRVCEDTPRPIRELNPETPEWLVAIIAKLHAKSPADRFQSANEVADLLSQHLAHLQQPALVPMPAATSTLSPLGRTAGYGAGGEGRLRGRRRWAVAAALFLLMIGGFCLTEATGVTKLTATMIRVLTLDGTLIVEVDDPGVKVTIEGDGGIVITGAGLQEVRLKPGSYKVQAAKDGKPVRLDQELVTITRGDKQVVRVSREPPGQALAPGEIRCFEGHTQAVRSVAFSSDGRYVVTASGDTSVTHRGAPGDRDNTVRLWDVKTGKELRRFAGHDADVFGGAISADGRRILSCDGISVRLWDAATGHELRRFRHESIVYTVAFSPDGRYAASGGGDNDGQGTSFDCDVHLWDLESGKELRRFKGHTHGIRSLALSPDGRHLLTGSFDWSIRLWDVESGKEVRRFDGHTHWVAGVAFSRDGRHAVSASFDKTARIWEVETGKELKRFEVPQRVASVAFSPDGCRVLAGTTEGVMYLWDLQTGKELRRYEGLCLAISPDGRQALSGDDDGTVRLWELPEPVGEAQPFMVLGGKVVAERKFDTLAEAVQRANNGDTIVVRGNGPFITGPINIRGTALTIRAGEGFRPVIALSLEGLQSEAPLLESDSHLVLEGLEFQRVSKRIQGRFPTAIAVDAGVPLHIANCRFSTKEQIYTSAGGAICELRNCEFLGGRAVSWLVLRPEGQLVMDNCLHHTDNNNLHYFAAELKKVRVQLTRNTMLTDFAIYVSLHLVPKAPDKDRAATPAQVEASANVFDSKWGLFYLDQNSVVDQSRLTDPAEAEALMARLFAWRGQRNLYPTGINLFACDAGPHTPLQPSRDFKSLAVWKEFWGSSEAGSLQGRPRFQGGDLRAKSALTPELITPDDFRLRPDSAGYRAGKDGKDLGADVDQVGPGPAYERWKKTPAYQQWLKDTKQAKVDPPTGERQAFVLLGAKDVVVRQSDTLAEAVQVASDGDTIEVRGNGPFVSGPVNIGPKALVIRAAPGFQPVIKLDRGAAELDRSLTTDRPLVLEGLELHDISEKPAHIIWSRGIPLHVANCRFITKSITCIFGGAGEVKCELRNCEFASAAFSPLIWELCNGSRLIVDNNVMVIGHGGRTLLFILRERDLHNVSIQLRRNTITGAAPLGLGDWDLGLPNVPPPGANQTRKSIQMETSENIFDGRDALFILSQTEEALKDGKRLEPRELEALLLGLFDWRDQQNVYSGPVRGMTMNLPLAMNLPLPSLKSLADWQRFWKTGKADALEGHVRFQGGDLIAKAALTPEQVTAEDFRLRLDSAGYRAGKDGKDLGADIDLVGPGPAYERWKKTPAYQQWLKESGQVKK